MIHQNMNMIPQKQEVKRINQKIKIRKMTRMITMKTIYQKKNQKIRMNQAIKINQKIKTMTRMIKMKTIYQRKNQKVRKITQKL